MNVGPATFPILDGKAAGDVITFSTIHDVHIIDVNKTETIDRLVKFNYTAKVSGDKCHIAIMHAGDKPITPNELDVVRANE